MSWEADCKQYDECDNCEYFKKENARLREAVSSYQKSFDMEKRLFDIVVKELREEKARLHEYNREKWKRG